MRAKTSVVELLMMTPAPEKRPPRRTGRPGLCSSSIPSLLTEELVDLALILSDYVVHACGIERGEEVVVGCFPLVAQCAVLQLGLVLSNDSRDLCFLRARLTRIRNEAHQR